MRVFGVVVGWSALFPGDRQTAMFPRERGREETCCVCDPHGFCMHCRQRVLGRQKITDIGNK
jgi:hypothetical protein